MRHFYYKNILFTLIYCEMPIFFIILRKRLANIIF
jgi:hypothetical protein